MRQLVRGSISLAVCAGVVLTARLVDTTPLLTWAKDNFALYMGVLLFLKALSNLVPVLPGALFTVASIPIIGWLPAYIANFTGGIIGATIAYALGRRYGARVVELVLGARAKERLASLAIRKGRELEILILLRIFTSQVSEIVSYGAGVLKLPLGTYLLATALVALCIGLPAFYLARNAMSGGGILESLLVLFALGVLLFLLRNRYLDIGGGGRAEERRSELEVTR